LSRIEIDYLTSNNAFLKRLTEGAAVWDFTEPVTITRGSGISTKTVMKVKALTIKQIKLKGV